MAVIEEFSAQHESPSTWCTSPRSPPASARVPGRRRPPNQGSWTIRSFLKVDDDGRTIAYTFDSTQQETATSLRTRESIPADCPVYVFEVEVLSAQASSDAAASRIAVGIQYTERHVSRPGIMTNTLAVHSDTGLLHRGESAGAPYMSFGEADVVGVWVNRVEQRVSFYKNGQNYGTALYGLPAAPIFPCVGFDKADATVRVNFGLQPFRHTCLSRIRADAKANIIREIGLTESSAQESSMTQLGVVLDQLVHACCWKTAQAMVTSSASAGGSADVTLTEADLTEMSRRQKVLQLLGAGQIQEAMQIIDELAPEVLVENKQVCFQLNLQRFIELLRVGDSASQLEAMRFARSRLWKDVGDVPELKEELQEALTLLAYQDLNQLSHPLLDPRRRELCCSAVNGALVQCRGRRSCSRLERLVQQVRTVHGELARADVAACVVAVDEVLTGGLQQEDRPSEQ